MCNWIKETLSELIQQSCRARDKLLSWKQGCSAVCIKAGLQSGFHKSREVELVSLQGDEPGSVYRMTSLGQFTGWWAWVSLQGDKPGSVYRVTSLGQRSVPRSVSLQGDEPDTNKGCRADTNQGCRADTKQGCRAYTKQGWY